ncbi:MAG: hypothetical protein HQL09_03255 [Nitrospirae bacterium]|nr:hypothetical protein [Nitrospirota bacterium]
MNILLIGLSHCYQLEGCALEWKKFETYLEDLCLRERPDIIAEELNEEVIRKWNAYDSVARKTAISMRIDHLFCDPDLDQRRALGIKCRRGIAHELGYGSVLTGKQCFEVNEIEKTHWEKRERFWLDRLIGRFFEKCVFLLGANHVSRFSVLLTENGIQPMVIEKDWRP